MTAKKVEEPPAPDTTPLSPLDYLGDSDPAVPVLIAFPHDEPVVTEPAKPATKKEN